MRVRRRRRSRRGELVSTAPDNRARFDRARGHRGRLPIELQTRWYTIWLLPLDRFVLSTFSVCGVDDVASNVAGYRCVAWRKQLSMLPACLETASASSTHACPSTLALLGNVGYCMLVQSQFLHFLHQSSRLFSCILHLFDACILCMIVHSLHHAFTASCIPVSCTISCTSCTSCIIHAFTAPLVRRIMHLFPAPCHSFLAPSVVL